MFGKSRQNKNSPHTEMVKFLPMSLKSGLWMMNGQKFKDTRKKRQTIIECPALLLLLHQILYVIKIQSCDIYVFWQAQNFYLII